MQVAASGSQMLKVAKLQVVQLAQAALGCEVLEQPAVAGLQASGCSCLSSVRGQVVNCGFGPESQHPPLGRIGLRCA